MIIKKTIFVSTIVIVLFAIAILSFTLITKRSSTDWLIVLHSHEGQLTEKSGEIYLTIRDVSKNVVLFSDRPKREYLLFPTHEFIAQWDTIFASSPPNAAIVYADLETEEGIIIVELFNPVIRSDEISFPIKIVGGDYTKDKTYEDVNLFIESVIGDWWDGVVRAEITGESSGDSPSGVTVIESTVKESITVLAKAVDVDGWEESLQDSIISAVSLAADAGGEAGEAGGGGEEGRQIGSRIGAQIGMTAIRTSIKAILRSDIAGDSSLDLEAISEEIKEAVSAAAKDFTVAYVITDNILTAQEDNIEIYLSEFIDGLIALNTTSGNNIFCAGIDKDSNFLLDTFLYYLRLDLEGRIYYDLQSGMSTEETKTDVINNLEDDMELVTIYTIWVLQDTCLSVEDDDLYTQVFNQLFIAHLRDSDGDGITDENTPVNHLRTDGTWGIDVNKDGIEDFDLDGNGIVDVDLDGNDLPDLDNIEMEIEISFSEVDAASVADVTNVLLDPVEYNPLGDFVEFRYSGFSNPPNTPVYTINNFQIAEVKADLSGSGPFSSIQDQFTRFTTKSSKTLTNEATTQFDLLINEGFDVYGNTFDIDFITEDMIDEIAEDALEEAILDEAGDVIGE